MDEKGKKAVSDCIARLYEREGEPLTCANLFEVPSPEDAKRLIECAKSVIYPRFFGNDECRCSGRCRKNLENLYEITFAAVKTAYLYDAHRRGEYDEGKADQKAGEVANVFLGEIPKIFDLLVKDVEATLAGDPAADNPDLILLSYPGIEATLTYRLAHVFYNLKVPFLPRMMSEVAHSETGIDIHPGATIGQRFVIDHGTGVVIGETAEIGDNVKLYQGVTLGAKSLSNARSLVGVKRHPTICNDVTIYAGATILGGDTVIGKGAVIGSSAFITESVEEGAKVRR